ncbi:MAG: DUF4377 domain-containing protein, partial [Porticoccaceae bacterium]|nr:DUF4377 domain-containing protein [Porticoccaceae bacterium]
MHRYLITTGVILFALLATACNDRQTHEQHYSLWINSHNVPCQGVAPMDCLQTHRGDSQPTEDQWQLFYSTIQGFTFEPGYLYQLSVTERQLDPAEVPADAPSSTFQLVEVLQKVADSSALLTDIWALQTLAGNAINIPKNTINQHPVLELDIANQQFRGNDSCNQIFGNLKRVTQDEIQFGNIAGTRMACPEMALADAFSNAL